MKHWTDDDITHWIYGLVSDTGHLDVCGECLVRAQIAQRRRAEVVQVPEVSQEFLEAQRRSIYQRIETKQPVWLRFRLAASFALALVIGIFSFNQMHHAATPYVPLATPADERLYSDMVAIDQSNEPRAIKPIEKLFEE